MQLPLQTLVILIQSLLIDDWLHLYPLPHLGVLFLGTTGNIPFLSELLEQLNRAAVQLHLNLYVPDRLALAVVVRCVFGVEEGNDEMKVFCDVLPDHGVVLGLLDEIVVAVYDLLVGL